MEQMDVTLIAKSRGAGNFIEKLLDGDPFTVGLLIVTILVTALACWLAIWYYKKQAQRLADALGGFDSTFSPDGLFGKRIFVLTGQMNDVDIVVTAKKVRKGDYRIYLDIAKPKNLTWEAIQAGLKESREFIDGANRVDHAPDSVTLEYLGVGGNIDHYPILLNDVTSSIKLHSNKRRI